MRFSVLVVSLALAGALGCNTSNSGNDAGPSPDSGYVPMQPMQPMQPMPDGGPPVQDAGGDGAVETTLPPNFTLECPTEDVVEEGNPRERWAEERDAHGGLGLPATVQLRGATYRIEGEGTADVEAPFTLSAGKNTFGIVVFGDASVDDLEERGDLSLYTGDLSSSTPREADALSGGFEGLGLSTVTLEDGVLVGAIDVTAERAGNTDFYRASATTKELELDGIYMASLALPQPADPSMQSIQWMPTGPVVVHEATGLTFYEEGQGSVRMPPDRALEMHYSSFGIGGDFTSSELTIEGEPVAGTLTAVFGLDAELRAEAGGIEATDDLRVTQAINEAGLVLPAKVQLASEAGSTIVVAPGGERIIRVHYRERSYTADAVLGEIRVSGEGEDLIELQTGFLEDTLTAQLINAVADTGWAAPLAAITAIPAVSVVFIIDVLDCIFGGCLDLPEPLQPFPQWIEAGGIGTMEIRVKGSKAEGTYPVHLSFVGRNYCAYTVSLNIVIGDEPEPPTDAGTDGGDGAIADGG